jgi:hypothetical protein
MKSNRNLFIVLVLLAIFGASCQKYTDGPAFSFRTPEKRLIKKWKITSIYKNDNCITDNNDSVFELKKNNEFDGHITDYSSLKMNKFVGTWRFTGDKKTIVCNGTVHSSLGDYTKEISYDITQLRMKDLWITETFYTDSVTPVPYGQLDYHYIPY